MNNISVRINNTDTQDNANGLYIRILEADEITDIYNEHIVTDFPASEVKPLSQMLRKREQGQYFVYGMFEDNGELAGYAYFIKCSNKDVYLLDYLAIVKNKRSKHLGSTFLQELKNLNQEVITMSQMVQDAIDSSFQALSEHNTELADKIIKGDRDVDNMERKIETHCLMLMLKQQPVASDLRHISTALKVVTDLERMGDQAADIADLSLRLEAADYGLVSKHLPAMVANVKTMVKDAIRAFIERDTETAETFEQRDDLIDAFFERVKREVIEFLKKDGDKSDVAVDVLMVAKYLERIADHAVNVCEWTEFSDTGAVGNVMIL